MSETTSDLAGEVPGRVADGLREALAVLLAHERAGKLSAWGLADALLSGPLAPLLAKLRAVEAEIAEWEANGGWDLDYVAALRRALDA